MTGAAWRNGVTLGLLSWAAILLVIIGAHRMSVLTYAAIALVVTAVLLWPAAVLLERLATRRRDRARRRVSTYLTNRERDRLGAELTERERASVAAVERLGAEAVTRALDRTELYGRRDTALLPAAIDDVAHYPPRLTRRTVAHPLDALAGLDASVARHPANGRLAEVVRFPGPRP